MPRYNAKSADKVVLTTLTTNCKKLKQNISSKLNICNDCYMYKFWTNQLFNSQYLAQRNPSLNRNVYGSQQWRTANPNKLHSVALQVVTKFALAPNNSEVKGFLFCLSWLNCSTLANIFTLNKAMYFIISLMFSSLDSNDDTQYDEMFTQPCPSAFLSHHLKHFFSSLALSVFW